jgi:hypothetical protein
MTRGSPLIDGTGTECETIIRVHTLSGTGPIGLALTADSGR